MVERTQDHSRENRAQMVKTVREVAGDLRGLVTETMPTLLRRDDFKRAYETLVRIENAHRFDKDDSIDRDEVRRDFSTLVRGYILRAKGHSYQEIGEKLGDDRVVAWLMREQIPFSMYRDDPTRNAHFVKRMNIPDKVSTEFAYILGAYAGSRRPTSESIQVNFQSISPVLVEHLCQRVSSVCGIDMKVRPMQVGSQVYSSATSRAHEFAEYLAGISCSNTAVPWAHIQTGEERRAFLRGFFDFGGGTVDVQHGRFSVTRNENPRLLEEITVMLKREGVNARLRTSGVTTVFIDATVELLALAQLDVVQRPELASRLKVVSEIPSARKLISASDFDSVIEIARRLSGSPSPARVSAALVEADHPLKDLPPSTIRHWLAEGFEPPSVKRRREVEDLERKSMSPDRVTETGRAILDRLPAFPHPYVVVDTLAEFVGGARALSVLANVDQDTVTQILERKKIPDEHTYRAILDVVGLDRNPRIEAAARCPDGDSVRSLFKDPAEQGVFSLYRSAIMIRVKEAFERGEDPTIAARDGVLRAMERTHRVNKPER